MYLDIQYTPFTLKARYKVPTPPHKVQKFFNRDSSVLRRIQKGTATEFGRKPCRDDMHKDIV